MNKKKKAIFLDRDGVLNKKRDDYVKSIDELEIFPNIYESIKKFNENNFLVVIITNQSAINRKLTTSQKVDEIHQTIKNEIKKNNGIIDGIYVCPHTPHESCQCRKPKPGLLMKAIDELGIDPKLSWMVGDSDSDIMAGKNVGCKTIKIEGTMDLANATRIILNL